MSSLHMLKPQQSSTLIHWTLNQPIPSDLPRKITSSNAPGQVWHLRCGCEQGLFIGIREAQPDGERQVWLLLFPPAKAPHYS